MPAPRLPPSLATRPSSTASSISTVAHVLRLVQNGYLDVSPRNAVAVVPGAGSIRRFASDAKVSIGSRTVPTAHPPRARWRITPPPSRHPAFAHTYSSSAAQAIDPDHDHHDTSTYHYPATGTSTGISDNSAPFSPNARSPRHPLSSDQRFFRAPYHPDEWALLPDSLYMQLKSGFFQSAAHFQHDFERAGLSGRRLGAIANLARVFDLWRTTAVETEEWIWLEQRIAEITEGLVGLDPSTLSQKGVPYLASAIRAYALLSSGAEPEARDVVDQARTAIETRQTHSLSHAIAAIVYAKVGAWQDAKEEAVKAVNRTISRICTKAGQQMPYPSLDLDLLKEYEKIVIAAGRNEDIIDFIRHASVSFRHLLINSVKESESSTSPALVRICFDALKRIQHPLNWWLEEYEKDPGPRSRWLGSLLLVAISQDRTRLDHALALFGNLRDKGIRIPGESAINLCWLVFRESRYEARELLRRIRAEYPVLSHQALYRAMVLAQRAEWYVEEQQIWDDLCRQTVPTFRDRASLAVTHAHCGRVEQTIAALQSRVAENFDHMPDALQIVFVAHINTNNAAAAMDILDRITAIEPRLFPFNALLQLYADQIDVNAAVALFDKLLDSGVQPNVSSYTALITLFANRRDPVNANNVYRAMIDAGITPDAVAHAAIINAEVEAGDWSAAAKRWTALPSEMRMHRSVLSAILKALVQLSAPTEHVISLFRKIRFPSTRSWALVIQSASDSGNMDLARDLYEEMDQAAKEHRARKPDAYTFSILLHGYMRQGDGASARLVYDEMLRRDILPTSVTYGMIIGSFTESRGERSLEQAHDFAMSIYGYAKKARTGDRRHERALSNQNLFSPLVVAHGQSQNWEAAHMYFDMASEGGQEPSVHMYTQLMDVYRGAGDVDNVLETWKRTFQFAMDTTSFRKYDSTDQGASTASKLRPSRSNDNILCIPLSIVLDSLSTVGRYHDVKKVWEEVQVAGFGFDAGNYNHLSVALARTGDVEGAFIIAQEVLLKRYSEVKSRHHQAVRETEDNELPLLDDIDVKSSSTPFGLASEKEKQVDVSETPEIDARMEEINDLPVDPTFGPPNRRYGNHHKSPFTPEARASEDVTFLNLQLLKKWRPTDTLWRPSLLTVSVLDHAYHQLENARAKRAWVPLALPDEGDDAPDPSASESNGHVEESEPKQRMFGVALPLFNNVPLRNHMSGKPANQDTLRAFMKNLNKRYAKVLALIMFHRRKRQAAKIKAERGR